jgi:hypothetical protein
MPSALFNSGPVGGSPTTLIFQAEMCALEGIPGDEARTPRNMLHPHRIIPQLLKVVPYPEANRMR